MVTTSCCTSNTSGVITHGGSQVFIPAAGGESNLVSTMSGRRTF